MAPTTPPEEGGEASRFRSSRARWRRRRTPEGSPTPPTVTTRSRATQSEPGPPSQRGRWKRGRAAKEQSKKGKRVRAAGKSRENEENTAARTASRVTGEQEAAAASPAAEQASSEASSAVSSPLRWPYIPRIVKGEDAFGGKILEPFIKIDRAIVSACDELKLKYRAKRDRQQKLVTLNQHIPQSCLVNEYLLPARESATKTVLQVAKVVVGLSSYIDDRLLTRSSGFLIDWDEGTKVATVLTSALLMRSKCPYEDEWLGTDEYVPEAEVRVHLLDKDDTIVAACLLHSDKHYNLALFEVNIDLHAQIPSFSSELKFGQEVFVLGRDKNLYLNIDHGFVQYQGPNEFERHHYMFVNCGIGECGFGGPVIDLNGEVVGMANIAGMGFVPSSIILKCLRMWKKFRCIPRLHVGMKFSAIKFLDPAHTETIYRKCNIDAGLIVQQVAAGSTAEKLGVRAGDIIECWNGEYISTTVELDNLLLQMCEEHLDKGNFIDSNVDVPVGIFHTRKGSGCTIKLTVKVCDDAEVIARGTYPVSARVFNDDDAGPAEEAPHGIGDVDVGDD